MRRFATVFASKREKQTQNPPANIPAKRTEHRPLNTAPPTPALIADHGVSSASSSSGSASLYLHTPEDENNHNITIVAPQQDLQEKDNKSLPLASKKTWKTWLKPKPQPTPWQHKPVVEWMPPTIPAIDDSDEQDDSDSDAYDDDEEPSTTTTTNNNVLTHTLPPTLPLPINPSPARAFTSFRNLVQNSLTLPYPSPTPFTQRADAPYLFPRSCNRSRQLLRHDSTRSAMLKRRLLALCDEAATRGPTPSEQRSIGSLVSRLIPLSASVRSPPESIDEPGLSKTTLISLTSRGLRRWISRPCFEDRYAVIVPDGDGGVVYQRVVGGTHAVAALEYSEAIDAMVDFDLPEADLLPPPAPALMIEIPSPAIEPPSVVLSSPTSTSPASTCKKSPFIFSMTHLC